MAIQEADSNREVVTGIPIVSVDQEGIKGITRTQEGIKRPITLDIKEVEDTIMQVATLLFEMRATVSEMKVAVSEMTAQAPVVFEMRAVVSEMRVAAVSEAVKTQERIAIGMRISPMRNQQSLEATFHQAVSTPKTQIPSQSLPRLTLSLSQSFQPPSPSSPCLSQTTM